MAVIYYPKSQYMYQKNTVSASYESLVLAVNPNTVLYFDTASGINAISASELPLTSSWATTASLAKTAQTSSWASYMFPPAVQYGTLSASFNPLITSTGSCFFWMKPDSGSYIDAVGVIPALHGDNIRYQTDFSGTGSHVYFRNVSSPKCTMRWYQGPNATARGMLCVYSTTEKMISGTISGLIKPYWIIVAGKGYAGAASQASVCDGLTTGARMFCTIGAVSQLYCGSSLTAPTTASNDNVWKIWAFKSNGAASIIRCNGVQIAGGNAGTNTIAGLTIAGDFNGTGGDAIILEMFGYYCIADADVTNVENYLMDKYGITP